MREWVLRVTVSLLLVLFLSGCRPFQTSAPRYTVTATPVDVVGGGFGVCIAVDRTDAQGIWWWQPGPAGCASRITGPTVFRADRAQVIASADTRSVSARFTLPLQSGNRDVTLALQDSEMRVVDSGLRVPTERRANLEIPAAYGR